jgi:hypothetical protein
MALLLHWNAGARYAGGLSGYYGETSLPDGRSVRKGRSQDSGTASRAQAITRPAAMPPE